MVYHTDVINVRKKTTQMLKHVFFILKMYKNVYKRE